MRHAAQTGACVVPEGPQMGQTGAHGCMIAVLEPKDCGADGWHELEQATILCLGSGDHGDGSPCCSHAELFAAALQPCELASAASLKYLVQEVRRQS